MSTKSGSTKSRAWVKHLIIALLILLYAVGPLAAILVIASCDMSEESKEIINTFNSFENKDGVYYSQMDRIVLPDKGINVSEIKYNGESCCFIACYEDVFYAYTYKKTDKTHRTYYLLAITYDDYDITIVDTIENVYCTKSGHGTFIGFCIDNKLFLDCVNENYIMYDLDESSYSLVPSSAIKDFHNYSYEILKNKNFFSGSTHYGIEITNKTTEETKTITMDRLSVFAEGEYILSLKSDFTKRFFTRMLEKDGDIYILGLIEFDGGVSTYQCVVMKYDFENDNLSYYSSMYYDWDEVPTFYVN